MSLARSFAVLALTAAVGLIPAPSGAAEVAVSPTSVTITTPTTMRAASATGKAVVRPRYVKGSRVQVSTAAVTVRNSGGTLLFNNVPQAAVRPGNYRVRTTIKYRTFRYVTTSVPHTSQEPVSGWLDMRCNIDSRSKQSSGGPYGLPGWSVTLTCTSQDGSFDGSYSTAGYFTDNGDGTATGGANDGGSMVTKTLSDGYPYPLDPCPAPRGAFYQEVFASGGLYKSETYYTTATTKKYSTLLSKSDVRTVIVRRP